MPSAGEDDGLSPRSPFKSVIRAHLPNQQRTSVQVKPGQSVREALAKAMKRRKLTPEMCTVFKMTNGTKVQVPWDADIQRLEGEEITVEILEKFPITTSISHNFASAHLYRFLFRTSVVDMNTGFYLFSTNDASLNSFFYSLSLRSERLSSHLPTVNAVEDFYFKDFIVEPVDTDSISDVQLVFLPFVNKSKCRMLTTKC